MKKYILMLAVASTAALFACGNKEANTEATEEPVAVEEVAAEVVEVADSTVCDSAAACCDSIVEAVAE